MKKVLLALVTLCFITHTKAQQTVGLFSRTTESEDGYVLFSTLANNETFLIDKCGKQINTWHSPFLPGMSAYLLPDGSLLRPGVIGNTHFNLAGNGGIIEQLNWNSGKIWTYALSDTTQCQHHDICPLPNGNILAIVWELKSDSEANALGRTPRSISSEAWPDKIVELQPQGINGAKIVWEWHAWDHMIQDKDPTKPNFGQVDMHPELVNINFPAQGAGKDWMHTNSVAYNAALDQIVLSIHSFDEFWIIDHGTTTAEAASHTGGRYGKGGDLLYRWGNPGAYNQGTSIDHHFYGQHDVHWIPAGRPDAGKVLVYNNGDGRPQGSYSSVEVINLPMDVDGNYIPSTGSGYLPVTPDWIYEAPIKTDFFSAIISGAQRMENGNTLIIEGTKGHLFEVTPTGNTVWDYVSPVGNNKIIEQGKNISGTAVFRARQYSLDYPGFKGRTLTPGAPIETNPLPYTCVMNTELAVGKTTLNNGAIAIVNPVGEELILMPSSNIENAELSLYNSIGSICAVWKTNFNAGQRKTLALAQSLVPGIYTLQIKSKSEVSTHQLVRY
ncbi:MAG: aryl-sulfate sulfotransferase [Chitinophagaceae bacterium]